MMYAFLKLLWYFVIVGFQQMRILICWGRCCKDSQTGVEDTNSRKSKNLVPSDIWEAISFKQYKSATYLRTALLMQGLKHYFIL